MTLELLLEVEGTPVRHIPLESTRKITVGRSSENDFAYPDEPAMSRRHMVIESENGDWWIEDLKSKNGTLINGQKLSGRCRLEPNDRITVGRVTIVFAESRPLGDHTVVFVEEDATTAIPSVSTSLSEHGDDIEAALAKADAVGVGRIHALVEAGRELAQHRPLKELFPLILDLAVKAVGAKRGVLTTLENGELKVRAARGEQFRISRAVRDQVLEEKKSLLVLDTAQDEMLRSSMTIVQQKIRSLMAVPLQTADKVTGLIYVDMPDIVRPFTTEDLTLLTVMANVAAIRIEHARLIEVEQIERIMSKELEQAAEIQRNLLPRQSPSIPGLDIAGSSLPCRSVGGDYFDYVRMPGGRLAVIVGDVAGKGMSAALLMTSLQARVQLLVEEDEPLATLVTRLNRSVSAACPDNRFITFFIAAVDPFTGDFAYVNAGHNPPYLVRASGKVEKLTEGGPILGILKSLTYKEAQGRIEPGDMLAVYSDGVSEAQNAAQDEYGEDRLERELVAWRGQNAAAVVGGIHASLAKFVAGAPAADDITLVVVRRRDDTMELPIDRR